MTEPKRWRILPNEGLLPLKFGMSPQDVDTVFDGVPVESADEEVEDIVTEFRRLSDPTISYSAGRAVYVTAGWRVPNVIFGDTDVFQSAACDVLVALEKANGTPSVLSFGFLTFEHLHVATEGFYLDWDDRFFEKSEMRDQDDRIVMLHAPGTIPRVDDPEARAISFL